jgi:hypothetical protein
MSPLEAEIRATLRAEAARLDEVPPLRLPVADAHPELRPAPRASRVRGMLTWRSPLAAAAVVLLVATVLVTLKSLRNEQTVPGVSLRPTASSTPATDTVPPGLTVPAAGTSPATVTAPPGLIVPAAGGSPVPYPAAVPRYYVAFGGDWGIVVGDRQTGKRLAAYGLGSGGALFSAGESGAADDRTFVMSAAPTDHIAGPPKWYLVRIFPGAAKQVVITRLAIQLPANEEVNDIALSADGTELAVVAATTSPNTGFGPEVLQVFSVATGRLQHSWSTGFSASQGNLDPVSDLSWVGDAVVGFAVTYSPEVREQVRTLAVSQTGTNLMADSRLVWSQYVPASPSGTRAAPHTCDSPFLTGNGQAVVCGNFTKMATGELLMVWLAYPLATPTRPRVIGSTQEPSAVSNIDLITVEWVNPAGTQLIGSWGTTQGVLVKGHPATESTGYRAVIGNGKVTSIGPVIAPQPAW